MSKLERHNELKEAMCILHTYMGELQREFDRTPRGFFGGRRARHNELAIMSNALVELGSRFVARGAEIVAESAGDAV